jgi:hypothetical protein
MDAIELPVLAVAGSRRPIKRMRLSWDGLDDRLEIGIQVFCVQDLYSFSSVSSSSAWNGCWKKPNGSVTRPK